MEQPVTILNSADRAAALHRALKLVGCARGSAEQRELEALTAAIAEYDIAIAAIARAGWQAARDQRPHLSR